MFLKNVSIVKLLIFCLAMLMIGSTITNAQVTVNLPQETRLAGTYTIPITVTNPVGISSGVLRLYTADPTIAEITDVIPAGLTAGLTLTENAVSSSEYRVSWASANVIPASTTLMNVVVTFKIPGTTVISTTPIGGGIESLLLENFAGSVGAVSVNGFLSVPSVSISIPTDLTGVIGPVQIPINATSFSNVAAYGFALTYDNRILNLDNSVVIGTPNTLTPTGASQTVTKTVAGNTTTINVAVANSANFNGVSAPPLLYLTGTILKKGIANLNFTSFTMEPLVGAAFNPARFNGILTIANTAPVFNAIPDVSKNEGELVTINVSATDADGDTPITYAVGTTTLPVGAYTFVGGVLNWTPGYLDAGVYTVQFTANDGDGGVTTSSTVTITVGNTNRNPVLTLNPADLTYTKSEGQTLTIGLTGSDADVTIGDGDSIASITLGTTPANATFTGTLPNKTFNWVIGYDQAPGPYTLVFTVTDSYGATDVKTVTVNVTNVNGAPSWVLTGAAEQPDRTALEGIEITFPYVAIDVENDPVHYTLVGTPPVGSEIGLLTGLFKYTPPVGSAGQKIVQVAASDQINPAVVGRATTITVIADTAPTLAFTPTTTSYTVAELTAIDFTVVASDVDVPLGDIVTLTPTGDKLTNFTAGTGRFLWTPQLGDAGSYAITFTATDRAGKTAIQTINIVVTKLNSAPVFVDVLTARTVASGTLVTFDYNATDINPQDAPPALVYTLTGVVPAGAVIDPVTGVLTWTPVVTSDTVFPVTVTVTDGSGATAETTANVTVTMNRNPVLTVPANFSVNEGVAAEFSVVGTDPDAGETATLVYSYTVDPAITGATFNTATGAFAWTPGFLAAGTYTFSFKVVDVRGGEATGSLVLTVTDLNRAPVLGDIPSIVVNGGSVATFVATATDQDTDNTLTFSNGTLPDGATFNVAGDRTFTWTPPFHIQLIPYNVTVRITVTDNHGASDFQDVIITVVPVETAPSFIVAGAAQMADVTVAEGETLTFTYKAIDAEGDQVTYKKLDPTPASATLDPVSGVFSWKPTQGQAGEYTIAIQASDGLLSTASRNTKVTVTVTAAKPVWTGAGTTTVATKSVNYKEVWNFNYVAVDPNGKALTYSATITPATTAAVFTNQTGLGGFGQLVFTATSATAGNVYTIEVKATNSDQLYATTTTVLTVGPNTPPTFTSPQPNRQVKVHNVPVAVTFQYVANDVDGDPFTYSLISGKGSISATGFYSWIPVAADLATINTVVVRVTDAANPLIYRETTAFLACDLTITGVANEEGVPVNFALMQNFPNPFNPTTNIKFALPTESNVTLKIYNILGEEVASLINKVMPAGYHTYSFDASRLTSGMYIYKIEAGSFVQVKKMLLMK